MQTTIAGSNGEQELRPWGRNEAKYKEWLGSLQILGSMLLPGCGREKIKKMPKSPAGLGLPPCKGNRSFFFSCCSPEQEAKPFASCSSSQNIPFSVALFLKKDKDYSVYKWNNCFPHAASPAMDVQCRQPSNNVSKTGKLSPVSSLPHPPQVDSSGTAAYLKSQTNEPY